MHKKRIQVVQTEFKNERPYYIYKDNEKSLCSISKLEQLNTKTYDAMKYLNNDKLKDSTYFDNDYIKRKKVER